MGLPKLTGINGKWEYCRKDGKDDKNLCIWVMKLDEWFVRHYNSNFLEAVGIKPAKCQVCSEEYTLCPFCTYYGQQNTICKSGPKISGNIFLTQLSPLHSFSRKILYTQSCLFHLLIKIAKQSKKTLLHFHGQFQSTEFSLNCKLKFS